AAAAPLQAEEASPDELSDLVSRGLAGEDIAFSEAVQTSPENIDLHLLYKLNDSQKSLILESEDGAFGYLPSVREDESTVFKVLAHTAGDSEDVYEIAAFKSEKEASSFCDMVNAFGKEKFVQLSNESLEQSVDESKKISDLISEYAQKAESENLEFFVRDVEREIAGENFTLSEAKDYLDKELSLMREIALEMNQDNELVQE
ncbi:relaxase, partial [Salmonella enterica]|nr:relaxase [Salmonella enterica]